MINLGNYATGLTERDGILFSKNESKISYPQSGNENYFQVEENSFWFSHRNNCIAEGVLRYSSDSLFFDIGGGNGFVASGLENKGISTVLVEPGVQGCLNAQKRNLKNIVCSTLENASFNDNALPAIGLFDVIEHIDDDVEFLTRVHRSLIENGLVFITVPAFKTLWSNDDIKVGHFRRYTKKELEGKLKSIGFKIEYSTYIFSVLIVAVFLFRALPTKFGSSKKPSFAGHKNSHKSKNGIIARALNKVWEFELDKIRNRKIVPFGGSCFVIARKNCC
jgi:SAM-dependent methyltransferase